MRACGGGILLIARFLAFEMRSDHKGLLASGITEIAHEVTPLFEETICAILLSVSSVNMIMFLSIFFEGYSVSSHASQTLLLTMLATFLVKLIPTNQQTQLSTF
jgi:hypothetical protein